MPTPRPFGPSRPARGIAALAVLVLALVISGCTGDETTTDGTSATTQIAAPDERPVDDPLAVTAYADPTVPITAAVGERFALLLDAEPTEGFRWEVVGQGDPAVVLPLGSQFVPRDSLAPATTTTTTAVVPPEPDPAAIPADAGAAVDEPAVTTAEEEAPVTVAPPPPAPTTTTLPTRSLQVLSYVARAPGRTTITVRYVRVGTASDAPSTTLNFTVEVPVPPPLF